MSDPSAMDPSDPTQPDEELEDLARLEGQWQGEEVAHPSPWEPRARTAQARMVNRMALEDFVLIADYEQHRDGELSYSGHGIFTFDTDALCYVLYWFDCTGMAPNVYRGGFEDDDVLVLMREHGPAEERGFSRLCYDISEPDTLQTTMERSRDGENWQTLVEARYTRCE